MQQKIYCSNTINHSITKLINGFKETGLNQNGGEYIFIAPDRFSMSLEKEIFDVLGLEGAMNIDVVSFSRLALKSTDGKKRYLSDEGATLILAKVIARLEGRLEHYGRAARSVSFAREIHAVITAIRNSGYSVDDLYQVVPLLKRGTRKKFADIALIYDEYIKELQSGYDDVTTRLEGLNSSLSTNQKIKNADIFICGFYRFTKIEYDIIKGLIKHAKSVSISVTPTNNGKNDFLYQSNTLKRLVEIGEELNVKTQIFDKEVSSVPEPFLSINKRLFSIDLETIEVGLDKIKLYREANIYNEVNAIAKEVLLLTKNGTTRFNQIAIINCDESYQDIISSIFKTAKIPFFIDKKYTLSQAVCTKYLFSVLEVAAFGYRNDKILSLIKSPMFGLDVKEQCKFENLLIKYNINRDVFLKPFNTFEDCIQAEPTRKKIVECTSFIPKQKMSAKDFSKVCLDIITNEAALNEFEKSIEFIKDDETVYKSNLQAYEALLNVINEMGDLLNETENDIDGHISMLKSAAEAVDISLIPQCLDSVFIGNIKDSRLNDIKALFIMAATSETLPKGFSGGAIITLTDQDILFKEKIEIYPLPKDMILEEQFLILDLITKAQKLYVGYSLTKPDGTTSTMSNVIKELCYLTGQFPTPFDSRLCRKKNLIKLDAQNNDIKNAAELYFKGNNKTSITEVQTYFRCPYAHFLKYGIRLVERPEAALRVVDIGLIIHKAMEIYFNDTLGMLDDLSLGAIQILAKNAAEKALEEYKKQTVSIEAYTERIMESVKKECIRAIVAITQNILNSNYRPKYIEKGFGMGANAFAPMEIAVEEQKFKILGKIDRVDVYEDKAAVVDYKTGNADIEISDVYYGLKLQLFMYLSVLRSHGLRPQGAFNLPIKDSFDADGVNYRMSGMLIEGLDNINDFDLSIIEKAKQINGLTSVSSSHIPVKLKNPKDGMKPTTTKYLLSKKQMNDCVDYVELVMKEALKEILDGNIDKSPILGCGTCDKRDICLYLGEENQREYEKNIKLELDDELYT